MLADPAPAPQVSCEPTTADTNDLGVQSVECASQMDPLAFRVPSEEEAGSHNIPISNDYEDFPRVICRYGRGCTHTDLTHKEAFWHPPPQDITEEQFHSHYICNECSKSFPRIEDLQLHLKRKTAWSDVSLVGCRVSCLLDNKEWHEGFVRSLSAYGKHLVDFHILGERRWLNMKRVAFYIAERPAPLSSRLAVSDEVRENGEFKDDYPIACPENDGLAPVDDIDDWVYVEHITVDYAFAQSVLFKVFGNSVQETGHKTRGHTCLTDGDKCNAKFSKGSLLYGELLPRGANKAFGPNRLDCGAARVLFDLGMGTGKVAIQAFLQFRNLEYVYGVELSEGRYRLAEEAVLRMVSLLGKDSFQVQNNPGRFILITEKVFGSTDEKGRVLHLECGNLFDTLNVEFADVVMLETDIPATSYPQLCQFLNQMHIGARTLSYLDLGDIWSFSPFNFKQLETNRLLSDRFPTSWSVQRGHHFFIWGKVSLSPISPKPIKVSSGDAGGRRNGSQHSRKRLGRSEEEDEAPSKSNFGCMPSMFSFFGILSSGVGSRDVSTPANGGQSNVQNKRSPVDAGSSGKNESESPSFVITATSRLEVHCPSEESSDTMNTPMYLKSRVLPDMSSLQSEVELSSTATIQTATDEFHESFVASTTESGTEQQSWTNDSDLSTYVVERQWNRSLIEPCQGPALQPEVGQEIDEAPISRHDIALQRHSSGPDSSPAGRTKRPSKKPRETRDEKSNCSIS